MFEVSTKAFKKDLFWFRGCSITVNGTENILNSDQMLFLRFS